MSKNIRLLLKGLAVSIAFIIPAIHFTVYCVGSFDWFVWYSYVFVTQGAIWTTVSANWITPCTLSLEDLEGLLRNTHLFEREVMDVMNAIRRQMNKNGDKQ